MKQFTSRLSCETLTHSMCRGDFSSTALAQSCAWAGAVSDPKIQAAAKMATKERESDSDACLNMAAPRESCVSNPPVFLAAARSDCQMAGENTRSRLATHGSQASRL